MLALVKSHIFGAGDVDLDAQVIVVVTVLPDRVIVHERPPVLAKHLIDVFLKVAANIVGVVSVRCLLNIDADIDGQRLDVRPHTVAAGQPSRVRESNLGVSALSNRARHRLRAGATKSVVVDVHNATFCWRSRRTQR